MKTFEPVCENIGLTFRVRNDSLTFSHPPTEHVMSVGWHWLALPFSKEC